MALRKPRCSALSAGPRLGSAHASRPVRTGERGQEREREELLGHRGVGRREGTCSSGLLPEDVCALCSSCESHPSDTAVALAAPCLSSKDPVGGFARP